MSESYKVRVKVISQRGTCAEEHKVGDQWIVGTKTPEGICIGAFNSLAQAIEVLTYGGSFPWSEDQDIVTIACPDATNPVVFELRRLRE
ncbi:TIGR04076 family protein [Chloroflexota bacterium]